MSEANATYGYSVRTDFGFPVLIRYHHGAVETFDPGEPGEWRRSPTKDSILYGGGDFVWYDDITEEEAKKYMEQIRKHREDVSAKKD